MIGFKGISKIVPPEEFEVVILEFQNDEVIYSANGSTLLCMKQNHEGRDHSASGAGYALDVLSPEIAASIIAKESAARSGGFDAWDNEQEFPVNNNRKEQEEELYRALSLVA